MTSRDLYKLATPAVEDVFRLLRQTRATLKDLLVRKHGPQPTEFDRFVIAQKAEAIDGALDRMARQIARRTDRMIEDAALDAVRAVQTRVSGLIGRLPIIGVDEQAIAIVQELAATQIVKATDAMRSGVRLQIARSMAGALTPAELASELDDILGGRRAFELERIIRTEHVRAYGQNQAAAQEQMVELGILDLIKVWRATPDDRTRDEHAAMDGQERELWQLFNMGDHLTGVVCDADTPPGNKGWRCNGPADPSLPPHLSIQCRCTVEEIPRSAAKRQYIAKDPKEAARRRKRALQEAI